MKDDNKVIIVYYKNNQESSIIVLKHLIDIKIFNSWDEMGKYDIPTAVDFILEETKQDKLYYIGHSMGTTMFWVALNEHPNLKDKISLMVGMGPVAKVKYMKSPLRFLSPFVHEVEV